MPAVTNLVIAGIARLIQENQHQRVELAKACLVGPLVQSTHDCIWEKVEADVVCRCAKHAPVMRYKVYVWYRIGCIEQATM